MKLRRTWLLVAVLLALGLTAGAALAQTVVEPADDVQGIINDAAPGATIRFQEGDYTTQEILEIPYGKHGLVLESLLVDGAIVKGFNVYADGVIVSDFKVENTDSAAFVSGISVTGDRVRLFPGSVNISNGEGAAAAMAFWGTSGGRVQLEHAVTVNAYGTAKGIYAWLRPGSDPYGAFRIELDDSLSVTSNSQGAHGVRIQPKHFAAGQPYAVIGTVDSPGQGDGHLRGKHFGGGSILGNGMGGSMPLGPVTFVHEGNIDVATVDEGTPMGEATGRAEGVSIFAYSWPWPEDEEPKVSTVIYDGQLTVTGGEQAIGFDLWLAGGSYVYIADTVQVTAAAVATGDTLSSVADGVFVKFKGDGGEAHVAADVTVSAGRHASGVSLLGGNESRFAVTGTVTAVGRHDDEEAMDVSGAAGVLIAAGNNSTVDQIGKTVVEAGWIANGVSIGLGANSHLSDIGDVTVTAREQGSLAKGVQISIGPGTEEENSQARLPGSVEAGAGRSAAGAGLTGVGCPYQGASRMTCSVGGTVTATARDKGRTALGGDVSPGNYTSD